MSWKDFRKKGSLSSQIPPKDWKYWCMVVLSLGWFSLTAYLFARSSLAPSINQWWIKKSQQAQFNRMNSLADSAAPSYGLKKNLIPPYSKSGDYYLLNFDILSGFPSQSPEMGDLVSASRSQAPPSKINVPASIQSLDNQKISVVGFMIPMTLDNQAKVLSFVLVQSRMNCCYGVVPKLNQWIYVTMEKGKATEQRADVPITVFGTLNVGNQFNQDSSGWCLYHLTSDKVGFPKSSWF